MSDQYYDEDRGHDRRLGPASPAVIWGVLMTAAILGAGATIWRGVPATSEKLVASSEDDRALRRDVSKLTSERDQLATRLAAVERELGSVKLAMRDAAGPETTGSINRPAGQANAGPSTAGQANAGAAAAAHPPAVEPQNSAAFALSLGTDASLESVRRRWSALSARYPQALARLTPRAQRSDVPGVYDLVAGPFVTRQEAERVCGTLAEQGFACDTTNYAGDPLGRP